MTREDTHPVAATSQSRPSAHSAQKGDCAVAIPKPQRHKKGPLCCKDSGQPPKPPAQRVTSHEQVEVEGQQIASRKIDESTKEKNSHNLPPIVDGIINLKPHTILHLEYYYNLIDNDSITKDSTTRKCLDAVFVCSDYKYNGGIFSHFLNIGTGRIVGIAH